MENKNIKKFYQQAAKPFNYLPNDLVDSAPTIPPVMSGLMRIDPEAGSIWISAGNTLVSDWKLITGGGGGGGGSQGLQDVIIQDAVLTQNNTINANGNFLVLNNLTSHFVNLSGKYSVTIEQGDDKNEITAESTFTNLLYSDGANGHNAVISIYGDSGLEYTTTGLFVNNQFGSVGISVGTDSTVYPAVENEVIIKTPAVDAGTATVGQVLTLQDAATGRVEFEDAGSSVTGQLKSVVLQNDVLITTGSILPGSLMDAGLSFPVTAGKTYSFTFKVFLDIPDNGMGFYTSINGPTATTLAFTTGCTNPTPPAYNITWATAYDQTAASGIGNSSFPGINYSYIEGIVTVSANGNIMLRAKKDSSSLPALTVTVKKGSFVQYYEVA